MRIRNSVVFKNLAMTIIAFFSVSVNIGYSLLNELAGEKMFSLVFGLFAFLLFFVYGYFIEKKSEKYYGSCQIWNERQHLGER